VLCEALLPAMESRWPGLSESYQARYEVAAGTLLAHDAAQRAARGEMAARRSDVELVAEHVVDEQPGEGHEECLEAAQRLFDATYPDAAAPTPKETDR
jgi:hypothetical protein